MAPPPVPQPDFQQTLEALRPRLHRYCARMTGSTIDGEDAVQEALARALAALDGRPDIEHLEGWLFRIALHAAVDLLRRRQREEAAAAAQEVLMSDQPSPVEQRLASAAALRSFMRLPVSQRSSVILMDVIGYSLEEVAAILDSTVPAVKASLHRGRTRLRQLADEPEGAPAPALSEPQRALLLAYVDRFNARDFDAVRAMLAQEVRLELVARTRLQGKAAVQTYFHNYDAKGDWRLVPGLVEGRPAALVYDPSQSAPTPTYFILLQWAAGGLTAVRDFRHARYAAEGAELTPLGGSLT